jgi:hypothetical protein
MQYRQNSEPNNCRFSHVTSDTHTTVWPKRRATHLKIFSGGCNSIQCNIDVTTQEPTQQFVNCLSTFEVYGRFSQVQRVFTAEHYPESRSYLPCHSESRDTFPDSPVPHESTVYLVWWNVSMTQKEAYRNRSPGCIWRVAWIARCNGHLQHLRAYFFLFYDLNVIYFFYQNACDRTLLSFCIYLEKEITSSSSFSREPSAMTTSKAESGHKSMGTRHKPNSVTHSTQALVPLTWMAGNTDGIRCYTPCLMGTGRYWGPWQQEQRDCFASP